MIRRVPYLSLVAPLALLAACGNPAADNAADPTNAVAATGNAAATVEDLPEGQRNAVLLRAILDAGQQCQGVTRAVKVSSGDPRPTWDVECQGGGQWVVAIDAAGTAIVTDRAAIEAQNAKGR